MGESLRENPDRARQFLETHIYAPKDFDAYVKEQLQNWKAKVSEAVEAGEAPQPFWLRRNEDSYTQFAAHIDYLLPIEGEFRTYAAIDISSDSGQSEVEVQLPKGDGSGEPVVAFREAYTLQSLERAITFAEESARIQ